MGPAGLTAVFGMGTGGAPPVSSPELGRGGVSPGGRGGSPFGRSGRRSHALWWWPRIIRRSRAPRVGDRYAFGMGVSWARSPRPRRCGAATSRGGQAARLLGPVGCGGRPPCTPGLSTWSSPRSLRTLSGAGNLVSKRASRLDAFSAYPFPTWLPGDAPSGTAGTPEVGPPQSSRTRGDPSQVSHAHGR